MWASSARRLAVHTGMGYANGGLPPRALRKRWREPSAAGRSAGRHSRGSIMDAKTGANIKSGKFVVGDKETTFPIYDGTIGPAVIDIGKFYAETGMFTYDPGYTSTGSCGRRSRISTAMKASCSIAGIRSNSWPSTATFSKPAISCSTASFPPAAQKADFDNRVTHHTMVHEQMSRFYQGFRRDAHPMAVMTGCVGALSAFYRPRQATSPIRPSG